MTERDAPPTESAPQSSSRGWQPAVIVSLTRLTPGMVGVRLRPQQWRPFLAGQHVDVRLTAADGYQAQRSYSVASPPDDDDTIELVVERLPDGEVSSYFHDAAMPGDELEVSGPFAEYFVWRPSDPGAVLLAAGGSGVAPFLSMVRQRATFASPPPMLLLYSARTWDDVIARDELLAHARRQPLLGLCFCLTRDQARRDEDFSRRVDRTILTAMLSRLGAPPSLSYVCGTNQFVGTVADLLVDMGVAASAIRTERYGGT